MRILFLTQIIPYPPDAGPKVKTWHVLRYLMDRGHEVILASFVRAEEQVHVETLQDLCTEVHTVPIVRSRFMDGKYWLKSHFTNRPFLIERDDLAVMRELVSQQVATGSIDVIHADQLTMTQFAFNNEAPHLPYSVFDAHNAVWTIVERMQQNAAAYLKPVMNLESKRIKRYEGMVIDKFDQTLALTDVDQQALLEAWNTYKDGSSVGGERQNTRAPLITIIPITVDTEQLAPIARQPGSKNIMTMGTLHYPPNADGVRWFVREVFPLISKRVTEATLTIVGKNPPQDLIQLAARVSSRITITGYVPDLKPYMEAAALMVVPVRAGSGMRVRILEAFARAMPVVTTTVGLEGIDVNIGEDILVQDTSKGFASSVVQLLEDEALQAQLASNGRRIAQDRYDWKTGLKRFDDIYEIK